LQYVLWNTFTLVYIYIYIPHLYNYYRFHHDNTFDNINIKLWILSCSKLQYVLWNTFTLVYIYIYIYICSFYICTIITGFIMAILSTILILSYEFYHVLSCNMCYGTHLLSCIVDSFYILKSCPISIFGVYLKKK